jgi:hypothetical protein
MPRPIHSKRQSKSLRPLSAGAAPSCSVAVLVTVHAGTPSVLVIPPVVLMIIVAFPRLDDAARGQHRESKQKAANNNTFDVNHGNSSLRGSV